MTKGKITIQLSKETITCALDCEQYRFCSKIHGKKPPNTKRSANEQRREVKPGVASSGIVRLRSYLCGLSSKSKNTNSLLIDEPHLLELCVGRHVPHR